MADNLPTDLENLLSALDSKDEQTRADAIRQVRALPPDALLLLSQLEVKHFKHYHRSLRDKVVLMQCVSIGLIAGIDYLINGKQHIIVSLMNLATYVFIVPYIMIYVNGGVHASRVRKSLIAVLEEAENIVFVPVALTLLQDKTAEIMPAITGVLKRLLPQLHAGDAEAWTPQQYQMLLKLLSMPLKDIELALCVLKALEQIGDARAIPAVTALANAPVGVGTIRIRTAAQACLPYLQQRAGEQKQAHTLLRPAASQETGETLLRPILNIPASTPDEQLLRPQQTPVTDRPSG